MLNQVMILTKLYLVPVSKNEEDFKSVLKNNYKKNKVFENYVKGTFTDAQIQKIL